MSPPRIVAFAGSLRAESYNRRLVKIAIAAAEKAGAAVTHADLREFRMPVFDEDLEREQGMPEPARRFKQLLIESQGMIIAAPEYNSSISSPLKNAIDWASRRAKGEASLLAYQGKVAGLLAASPGALGGLRGLVTVRSILGNIGVVVLPEQVAVAKAHEAFDGSGNLKDAALQAKVEDVARKVVEVTRKLNS
jgi:NAD(P)H-dependent FMN reductase